MSGPFYFCWIENPEPFNPDYHAVEDEAIFSFSVSHAEGDFATLQITIENPQVGLLSRPVWAWLSWDRAWQRSGTWTPDYVPLFLGRLVGIPNTINKKLVTLNLIARPRDYADQREAVAAGLRVLPYWDPIFISQDKWSDPDTALEAYSKLWHFDRLTHVVTTSDIIVGEDGVVEFGEDEIPHDAVELSLSQPPFRRVAITGTAQWTQQFGGTIPIINEVVNTYTGGSLISGWPKEGANLGEGYIAAVSYAKDKWRTGEAFMVSGSTSWSNPNDKHQPGDTMSTSSNFSVPVLNRHLRAVMTRQTEAGIGKASVNSTILYVMEWLVEVKLEISYAANRGRTENALFVMESNIQPVLTDDGDTEVKEIAISANDVAAATIDDSVPIGDVSRSSYFATDRGNLSLQYLLLLARANLVMAARCAEVRATIPFWRAVGLSCRMNGIVYDRNLPGGQAVGKIKEYGFSVDGNSGVMAGYVKLASAIGKSGAVSGSPGEPTYVDEGYVDAGYQEYAGQIVVLPVGDVAFEVPQYAGEDDGLQWPLSASDVIVKKQWHGTIEQQIAAINAAFPVESVLANWGQTFTFEQLDEKAKVAKNNIANTIKDKAIWLELELRNINGKFNTDYNVNVLQLEIPRQIDLEFTP